MTEELKMELKNAGYIGGFSLSELIDDCPKTTPTKLKTVSSDTFVLGYNQNGYWVAGYEAYGNFIYNETGATAEEAVGKLRLYQLTRGAK